jgi:heptosyltransferase-3
MFKAWRPEANARVIDYLSSHGLAVVVTAAPEAKELEFVQKVFTHVQTPAVDLSGRLNLSELAALIAGGRIFFGVDSLPMHMAAAVGTRSVVLFGPSGEHMWGPWGPGHQVITKPWDCRPCGRDGCHSSKISRCLVETLPEEVFPALDRVLADQR